MKTKLLVIGVVCAIVILTGTVVYAASVLNQDVGVTVQVKPSPTPSPSPTPTEVKVYSDIGLTQILTTLNFDYILGASHTLTGYVSNDVLSSVYEPTLSGGLAGIDIDVNWGATVGDVQEVLITAGGGVVGNYTGTIKLTGAGD